MDIKRKILIAYKHKRELTALMRRLKKDSNEIFFTTSGEEAMGMAQSHCPELILLGTKLDDMDGISVLRSIRGWLEAPVVMLASECSEREVMMSFDSGADDFMLLSFSIGEMLSRIGAAIRHRQNMQSGIVDQNSFRVGDLVVDYDRFRAYVSGKDADLTHNEFRLVSLLSRNAGSICTYEYLISQMWGPNADTDNQILRVNMTNIRRKIELDTSTPRYIRTISGVGYRMAEK